MTASSHVFSAPRSPEALQLRFRGVSHSYIDAPPPGLGDHHRRTARRVLTNVTFTVSAGERVGIIGENGSGKSTLLRIAAGLLVPDHGSASLDGGSPLPPDHRAPGAAVGLLHQQPPFDPGDSVHTAIESAVAPIRSALSEVRTQAQRMADAPDDPAVATAYTAALEAAEYLDAWDIDNRIASTLTGLGLGGIDVARPVGALSGGQRARLSIAWLLLNGPALLLLDEPTNHLDDDAIDYLGRVIAGWRGAVMIASHDRAFLDATVSTLIDLDPAPMPYALASGDTSTGSENDSPADGAVGVTRFSGRYSEYLDSRERVRERWERQYREEQSELRRLRASIGEQQQVGHSSFRARTEVRAAKKFYADRNARVVARRVNDSRSRLEALEARQIARPTSRLEFAGLVPGSAGRRAASPRSTPFSGGPGREGVAAPRAGRLAETRGPILECSGVAVEDRLAPLSFALGATEKLLITGPNGVGKSTLLRLLSGAEDLDAGSLHRSPGMRVGLLAQETGFHRLGSPRDGLADIDEARTAEQAYAYALGDALAARTPLQSFGLLAPRDAQRPVGSLSVGQRRRLELAIVLADPPDLLLLDEPTNHLSVPLVSALESAIPRYPGAVVVASHDRWLRERWSGTRLRIPSASVSGSGSGSGSA